MRVVMTLLARNEADIIDAQVAFHLNAGVDFVVATDHDSTDATPEILESYAREGVLHLIRERGPRMRQAEWVTRMARLAAREFGADWVINSDADEFWWPRARSVKDVFAAIPERYGIVSGVMRHFAPRPGESEFFERMTVRLRASAHPLGPTAAFSFFGVARKVAHRGDPSVAVGDGNHDVTSSRLLLLRGWFPFEILHFPLRALDQSLRKFGNEYGDAAAPHHDAASAWLRAGRGADFYKTLELGDDAVRSAIADGRAALDTRVRDVLRRLRLPEDEVLGARRFRVAPSAQAVPLPTSPPDSAFVEDVAALQELDSLERALARAQALERRSARVLAAAGRHGLLEGRS